MISNGGIFGASGAGGFLDAGLYSANNDGRGAWATNNTMNKRATVSYWYKNNYANSSYGTMFWGHYHGGQDHTACILGTDGCLYYYVKYNNGHYHNVKSSVLASAKLTHNVWHHYCMIAGSSTVKHYIDGDEVLSRSASDYTDIFSKYWGYHSSWNSSIGNLTGSPSFTMKGVTYLAQHAVVTGASPGTISEFINSDGTPIDFLDIDGNGTDLDTTRASPENASELNGIWMFGANGTTSSTSHNSATDGSSNSNWNVHSGFALSTDTGAFPVTAVNTA